VPMLSTANVPTAASSILIVMEYSSG
jgi:hypothetical protein